MKTELSLRNLFDVEAPDASTGIINGRCSNLLNWNDTAYKWARGKYKNMMSNHWIPEEQNMTQDKKQYYEVLNVKEREAYNFIISSLYGLDSIQTDAVGHFSDYITSSEVNAVLKIIAKEEVVHNESYSYTLSSIVTNEEQKRILQLFKTDPVLTRRNAMIFEAYKRFTKERTVQSFIEALIGDVMLEGGAFYAAFAFFYDLARQGKMIKTAAMINWINRDEQIHVGVFCLILREVLRENPEYNTPEFHAWAIDFIRRFMELEMEWGEYLLGQSFENIDLDDLRGYLRFIGNKRARELGLNGKPFPDHEGNPMGWIKVYEDMDLGKVDFFEGNVRQYTKPDDEFDDLE